MKPHLNRLWLKQVVGAFFATAALASAAADSDNSVTFRFASWNIGHYALGESGASRLSEAEAHAKGPAYRAFLDEVGADVLGVCEESVDFSADGRVKSADAVFPRYGKRVVGPSQDWRCNACFWNAFDCLGSDTVDFAVRKDRVYYLATRLRICGEEVVFVQTHLDWNNIDPGCEDVRQQQYDELVRTFRNERHVVIAGDFNPGVRRRETPGGKVVSLSDNPSEYKVFEAAGFTLGNDGRFKTAPAGKCTRALDNIIVKGLRINGFKVWDRPDLSDHALVSAELELVKPDDPVVMMRFSSAQTRSREEWKRTARAFADNPGCCDEVWFSTGESFPSLDWHRRHVECVREAAEDMRRLGVAVSLQYEATIGHGDNFPTKEEREVFDKPWTGWTGPDGTECRYCNCPRQPAFLERLAEVSALYAEIRPGVVWVDDDLRLTGHYPVSGKDGPGCWCEKCVCDFAAEDGFAWTRESLHSAWKSDKALRSRWEMFSARSLASVVLTIARVFRKVSPSTRVGLQTGTDRKTLANVVLRKLAEEFKEGTCLRMGGGAYYDLSPYDQLAKSWQMVAARRQFELEDVVDNWCTEVESYPRAYGSRSVRSIALESFSSMGWGFDTVSLFVMDRRSETDEFYSRYMLGPLAVVSRFLNGYRLANRGTSPAGFTCPVDVNDRRVLMGIPVLPGLGVSWGNIDPNRGWAALHGAHWGDSVWGDPGFGMMQDAARAPSAKLQAMRDRLSGSAPLKLCSPFMGMVLPRVYANGGIRTVGLIGTRLDRQDDIVIEIDTTATRAVWRELGAPPANVSAVQTSGRRRFVVPSLGAWNIGYLEFVGNKKERKLP